MPKTDFKSFGQVVWICGLSGAGKTTLALELVKRLRADGKSVVLLDGDELREVFGVSATTPENHAREKRLSLAIQYAYLCRLLASQGLTIVISTISLFREVFIWNRAYLPCYFEIYLKIPLDELRRRDSKGIYSRFDAGELTHVAGLDIAIDEPEEADWIVEFIPGRDEHMILDELMNQLAQKL